MTDQQITEAFFVARGKCGEYIFKDGLWIAPNSQPVSCVEFMPNAPDILNSYPDFKREVLEVMEEEWGLSLFVSSIWVEWRGIDKAYNDIRIRTALKDNNILHAAVIAATRYWENKNAKQ